MKKWGRIAALVAVMGAVALAAGCAATTTALRYKDLDVQTRMSDSIFLEPVPPAQRTVFIQVRNTSDKPFDIQKDVAAAIAAKGYKVVNDPRKAHYILQANVLQVGRTDKSALENALAAGYGGAIAGAAIGGLLGGDKPVRGAVVGGLVGSAIEAVTGSLVKVVWYAVITDVQISERTSTPVSQQTSSRLRQGTSTTVTQRSASTTHWKRYRTRIISSARKVDLTFEEAYPLLRQGLVRAISGLF